MKKLILIFILLFTTSCFAAQDLYQFSEPRQEQRFLELTKQLRCLVCQNQNLAESNAALATDLRTQIYNQIQQGKSDKSIVDYLVTRYGNFILYNPPINSGTVALWFGPFLILLLGLAYLIYYITRSNKKR
ncbi:MAG: cytochrome c-type biogenesis protein CcmH [Gammaproteobacteria bacterium]|nr:cytochrome c-type biogenesis protein CcmH [Gammaproteobacteria bacterium]